MGAAGPAEAARARARDAAVAHGRALFNRGAFWDSHESWESAWRLTDGEARIGLQGLIQAAAAFHKLIVQDNPAGAARLVDRAIAALQPLDPVGLGLDVRALLGELGMWRARLDAPPAAASVVGLPHLDAAPHATGGAAPLRVDWVDLRLVEVGGRRSLIASVGLDDAVGWGESGLPWDDHGTWHAARGSLAPALLTEAVMSPAELPVAWDGLAAERRAAAAIEMAMWDLAARRWGVPFHTALGLVARPVRLAWRVHGVTPAALADGIARARAVGATAVHLPARPNADRRLLPGLAAEWAGLWLAFDLDGAYRMADVDALRVLAGLQPAFLHRVFPPSGLADVRRMRRWLGTPLSIGDVATAGALENAHALGVAEVVQVDVGLVGPYGAQQLLARAAALGVAAWVGSPSVTPIAARAALALGVAPGASAPCAPGDGFGRWDDGDGLAPDGHWTPSSDPGLGVDPPLDWLTAHAVIHERLTA